MVYPIHNKSYINLGCSSQDRRGFFYMLCNFNHEVIRKKLGELIKSASMGPHSLAYLCLKLRGQRLGEKLLEVMGSSKENGVFINRKGEKKLNLKYCPPKSLDEVEVECIM